MFGRMRIKLYHNASSQQVFITIVEKQIRVIIDTVMAFAPHVPAPRQSRLQDRAPAVPPKPSPLSIPAKDSITFKPPKRRILTQEDLEIFQSSPTYRLLVNFVLALNEALLDTPLSRVKPED